MKVKSYLFVITLFALSLVGCSKSDDEVPAETTAELLARKWSFNEISVKTDAKTYVIPPGDDATFFESDDNTVTFNADNTYSTVENGKSVKVGTWQLSNKTLMLTDVDKITTTMTVNTLTATSIELATSSVSMTKTNPTEEELSIAFVAGMLLGTLDKDNGGTIDFTKEPEAKTLQILLKGKAL
ncbi:lipocalin family protein [Larkinella sp. VNQ87]|uniref:lipocalin family protein n=1 Tax=Larkinella sp. VNQ87 TaxID=3400921 RepID=UPI003BFB85BF